MKQNAYQPRTYRHWIESKDLVAFTVTVKETDLYIRATTNLQRKAQRLVEKYRGQLERYIEKKPEFQTSLKPLPIPGRAPRIIVDMIEAGIQAGVGPMAAVAGAISEYVGQELLAFSREIIMENGGDIFLKIERERTIGIYAGDSPLTGKIGLEISPRSTPLGICTSSGTLGHSLSYGKADAVVVTSKSTILADAAATAIGNQVTCPEDIDKAIEFGQRISSIKGIVIVVNKSVGAWGDIKLCETSI